MESCLYEGLVRHRRFSPVRHEFTYRLFLMYLDLAELDDVFAGRWLWSTRRLALARFRRSDHLGDPRVPLAEVVRDLVESRGFSRPRGPIRLLTQPRQFGCLMNPVSLYYCFDENGAALETMVAEVSNTPWGERHCYVLPANAAPDTAVEKVFHVSPFLPLTMQYRFRWGTPGRKLSVRMQNWSGGERVLEAVLGLWRRPLTTRNLAHMLVRFPVMSLKTMAGIYWQAARLWWKGAVFHPHPGGLRQLTPASSSPRELLTR